MKMMMKKKKKKKAAYKLAVFEILSINIYYTSALSLHIEYTNSMIHQSQTTD